MKYIVIILSLLFVYNLSLEAQTIYIHSNVTGVYIYNTTLNKFDGEDRFTLTTNQPYATITYFKDLEIIYLDNQRTCHYQLYNLNLKENDTLNLFFYSFHITDTTYYSAFCLNGTSKKKDLSIKEINKGFPDIHALPKNFILKIGNSDILFHQFVNDIVEVQHANIIIKKKKCAFEKNTFSKEVVYTNSN